MRTCKVLLSAVLLAAAMIVTGRPLVAASSATLAIEAEIQRLDCEAAELRDRLVQIEQTKKALEEAFGRIACELGSANLSGTTRERSRVPSPRQLSSAVPTPSAAPRSSVQCSATTQRGTRCKRMTTHSSGRCYQHQ